MFGPRPIRITILTNFLLIVGLIAAVLLGLQYHYSHTLAVAAASKTFRHIAREVTLHSRVNDASTEDILYLLREFPALTHLPVPGERHPGLERFARVLERHPNLYAFYIGFDNGDYYELINMHSSRTLFSHYQVSDRVRWTVIKVVGAAEKRTEYREFLDGDFNLLETRSQPTHYNPQQRIWFTKALEGKGVVRTAPYLFTNLRAPGVTYAIQLPGEKSVLAIDITMEHLHAFLNQQSRDSHSEIFLYSPNGDKLVSSSNWHQDSLAAAPGAANLPLPLTAEERQILVSYPVIRMSNQNDWAPFDFNVGGVPMGYSVDLLKLMAEKIGLQLQFVNGFDFSELMELFEKGELEVVQSLYRTPERERLGLFSEPLYVLQTHVVSRATDPVAAIADLNGKTVAVPRGWYAGDFLAEHYLHIQRLSVSSAVDALKAVASGRADAVLDTPAAVHYLCRKYFINGLIVGPHFEALDGGSGQGIYLMVQKPLAPLRDLFNKALASLSEEELRPLREKWFGPSATTALPTADSAAAGSMVEEAFLQAVSDRPDQVVSYRSQGREYLAFSTPAFGNGEYLGMVLPAEVILKPYMKTVAISLGAALIALLFSLPLILYSTSLIVKPIKALMVENEKVKKREFERVATVKSNICELLELSDSLVAMAGSIQAYQKAQEELMDSFLRLISEAIDAKSSYTSGHCNRVPELATRLARAASESELPCFAEFRMAGVDQWREFRIAAWLHDCGKVITPVHVVDKATKLETIYNRIHEVRTRFEVLWRDARIDALEKRLAGGEPGSIETDLQRQWQQLVEDFSFVADCNVDAVSMDPANRQRLQRIAARTWVRHFDNRIGLSKEEEQRWPEGAIVPPPATERLLADKPEHLIAHDEAKIRKYAATRFNLPLPKVQYNFGEFYNLCVERGTLTEEERFKIKEHVIMTIRMLEQLPLPEHLLRIPEYAGNHHETLDGKGYPRGLDAAELSIPARIMAIADIFEALTAADRPYYRRRTLSEALHLMAEMKRARKIDGDLFDLFLHSGIYRDYAKKYLLPEQMDRVEIEPLLG